MYKYEDEIYDSLESLLCAIVDNGEFDREIETEYNDLLDAQGMLDIKYNDPTAYDCGLADYTDKFIDDLNEMKYYPLFRLLERNHIKVEDMEE